MPESFKQTVTESRILQVVVWDADSAQHTMQEGSLLYQQADYTIRIVCKTSTSSPLQTQQTNKILVFKRIIVYFFLKPC